MHQKHHSSCFRQRDAFGVNMINAVLLTHFPSQSFNTNLPSNFSRTFDLVRKPTQSWFIPSKAISNAATYAISMIYMLFYTALFTFTKINQSSNHV